MKPAGIFALGSFVGEPVDHRDCAHMGLEPTGRAFVGAALDPLEGASTVDQIHDGDDLLLFLGRFDDPRALAASLAVPPARPAMLALYALRRWGEAARRHMPGSWSLLRWNRVTRTLDLSVSYNLRDHMFFARAGDRFAVAPSMAMLADLPWIDDEIDLEGFAYNLARARLRLLRGDRTFLRQVRSIEAGTFASHGPTANKLFTRAEPVVKAWSGGFDDAVAAATLELRQVVRRAIAPYRRVGILLSGGLDSGLLAWLASEELRADQSLIGLTSVAPPESGLDDERAASRAVADMLGFEMIPVWPGPDARLYRPSNETMEHRGLAPSPRHYLYGALFDAAQDRGVEVVLDGVLGEASVTRSANVQSGLQQLRATVANARRELTAARHWSHNAFHAEFAPVLLETLRNIMPRPSSFETSRSASRDGQPIGFAREQADLGKSAQSVAGNGLRRATCFHDVELTRLTAGMPEAFFRRDGVSRALARAMLAGRVPEAVRLGRKGIPFSPDYDLRAANELKAVADRIAAYRDKGVDRLVNVDWLLSVSTGRPPADHNFSRVQQTAMAAEFLVWWKR